MTEKEISYWLDQWQIHQHCICEDYDLDHLLSLGIEYLLLKIANLDLENDWEDILNKYGKLER